MGLALDIDGSELYWIEKNATHPRQSALMIINVKNNTRERQAGDSLIDKRSLINQDVGGTSHFFSFNIVGDVITLTQCDG